MDQKSIDKRVGILDWGIIFSFNNDCYHLHSFGYMGRRRKV